jgi:hypothetical protein
MEIVGSGVQRDDQPRISPGENERESLDGDYTHTYTHINTPVIVTTEQSRCMIGVCC